MLNIDDDDHDQNALVHFTTLCRETCIKPFSKFLRRNVADAPTVTQGARLSTNCKRCLLGLLTSPINQFEPEII